MEGEKQEDDLHHVAASSSSADDQDLPMMHWEELSQRIAELEEQERREGAKSGAMERMEEEEDDGRRCWAVTSRFTDHKNLQLCFINTSDSEDDNEEGSDKKQVTGAGHNSCCAAGLKQEVATALRTLRDKLLAEQKLGSSSVAERKHLERWELQPCSAQQLSSLRESLQQDVHALSSELVAHLLVRDQLRTRQDAMLLDVQDLT